MPPGPSSPASMPKPRKASSSGAPKRADNTPAKMLSSTSALPTRINWWLASTGRRGALASRSQFHWQDHHRHVAQVQPAQHRQRRLAVQLPDVPIVMLEDQLAGEEDAVRKFRVNLLGELGQLVDRIDAEGQVGFGGEAPV